MNLGPEYVSYVMLGVSTAYMVYFIVKIHLQERREIALMDEDFLLEKKKKK